MRDVIQVASICVYLLVFVFVLRRTRITGERRREWLPIIIISLSTIFFYISVFIDQRSDIMNSSDVSSTVRLISGLMLIIFVRYFPGRIRL